MIFSLQELLYLKHVCSLGSMSGHVFRFIIFKLFLDPFFEQIPNIKRRIVFL